MILQYKSLILRVGATALAAASIAACQTAYDGDAEPAIQGPRPNFPVRQENQAPPPAPAAPQQPIYNPPAPDYVPPPAAAPSRPIESQALPSPAPQASPLTPPPASPAPQAAAAPPPPPPPPATETRPIANGPLVDAEGPGKVHTVKAGETLYSISKSFDQTVDQVAARNGLKKPYVIHPGDKLKGPGGKAKAYVVQNGDTLSAVARRFSVSAAQIATANGIRASAAIRPGQKLILPSGYKDQGPGQITVAAAPAAAAPAAPRPQTPPATPAAPRAQTLPPTAPAVPAAPTPTPAPRSNAPVIVPSSPPATQSDIQTAGRGKFNWPVSGRVVSGFGVRGPNQQSNGLNISAATGTTVRASAAGDVIYAGSEVQDYGNLVLVRHDGGFVTVYAHLSKIDVKMQDRVTQGQKVGEVGQSGGLAEPQLYFEMRHQQTVRDMAKPFDPMLVLPPR